MSCELTEFGRKAVEMMPFLLREFARRESNPLTRGQMSFPQFVVLEWLTKKPAATMKELARALSVRMSSATVLVDRLIAQKMVSRERDASDRRLVHVKITAAGRRVMGRIMQEKQRTVREVFGCLSAGERRQYLSILNKISSNLKAQHEQKDRR